MALALAAAVAVAACGGGDDEEPSIPQSGERETTTSQATTTTTSAPAAGEEGALQIVVTNDDGVAAAGIDALVTALTAVDGVEVTVVAPAGERSGTGGSATEGPLTRTEQALASGYAATAVDGFPADTVRVAFDDLGLQPDLVISGINEGQNLGPLVDVSGTVGAARAALRRGVPALAVSQGIGTTYDYEVAAQLVVDWLEENRDALGGRRLPGRRGPQPQRAELRGRRGPGHARGRLRHRRRPGRGAGLHGHRRGLRRRRHRLHQRVRHADRGPDRAGRLTRTAVMRGFPRPSG